MPRENKRLGRGYGRKRKRHQYEEEGVSVEEDYPAESGQFAQNGEMEVQGEAGDDLITFSQKPGQNDLNNNDDDTPFYGLLDQQEQEYYANVNAKLEANDFESGEDKAAFLDAVHRESQGKELKIASSQSCSRYLERLIRVSDAGQVRRLFGQFVGHFLHLVQHRFASHCCEALFLKAAAHVREEKDGIAEHKTSSTPSSLEQLFLTAVAELLPNIGYLLTERFASHVIRVLLLVLSGEPLDDPSASSVLASRKKEKVEAYASTDDKHLSRGSRQVPQSFNHALTRLITSSVSGLDTTYIRALATHPTGSPTLQLLLRLELVQGGKSKAKDANSVFHRLLPDESLEEDSESAKFIQGLLYDPTGSRLLETIIQHAPGKSFKKMFGNVLKHRIGAMAKNDIASYVAIRILERLNKEDLQAARDGILPEISTLVARNRVGIIRVLVERCDVRHVDCEPVVSALRTAYGDDQSNNLLLRMLKMVALVGETTEEPDVQQQKEKKKRADDPEEKVADIHGSLLAQTLLRIPATFPVIHQSIQLLPNDVALRLAKDPAASRVMQQALNSSCSDAKSNRKLVSKFYGHMADLAVDASGSHLADALWSATDGSYYMKERLAQELRAGERRLRDSRYGRTVWRNWSMDMFATRPMEWRALAKGTVDRAPDGHEDLPKKTALELARERFACQKAKASSRSRGPRPPPTQPNTVSIH